MVDLYRGKHYGTSTPTDRLVVNLAFATKNVIAPSVAVNNPKFNVDARRPESAPHAVITQEVLNYLWRVNKYQRQFRLAVDDDLSIGHGWIKVGYKFVKPPEVTDVDSNDAAEVGVDDRDDVDGNTESHMPVTDDRPYVERISPFDIYVDPDARNLNEMGWIAQRIRRRVADVRADKRYDAKVRKDVGPSTFSTLDEPHDETAPTEGLKGTGFVDVIEFYNIRTKTVCTFAANHTEGFLIKPKPMPYAFGHPFIMLRNYEVMDTFYPMGELEQIESLQHELNETRSQMMNHRKRYARKYLYDESMFGDEGIKDLESDEDNVMVPTLTQGGDIEKAVIAMPAVGTPPDFYNQSEIIQSDMDSVSGVSDYQRGQTPNIRRTATEAAMIQDSMNSRAADKLSTIEETLAEIAQRVTQLMQQYLTGEHVVRVVGSHAMPVWINYDKDYIAGEFDFSVEGGSTQPNNESYRRQSALQLVDAMAPFVGAGVVDPQAVAREVLKGFGIKDPESFLAAQAPAPASPPGGQPVPGQMQLPLPGEPVGAPEGDPESPIEGIPAELVQQLAGQFGLG
jgi:hypothetical protein